MVRTRRKYAQRGRDYSVKQHTRRGRQRGKRFERKGVMTPFLPLFAPKCRTILKYATSLSLNSGVTVAYNTYAANGLYDPDITGTGHGPLGFTEMKALGYGHYRVLGSKITLTPIQSSTSNSASVIYGVVLDGDTTLTYTSGTEIIEDPRHEWSSMNVYYNSNASKPKAITKTFSAKNYLAPEGYNNATAVTANPSGAEFVANFHVYCASLDGTIDPGTMWFAVEIEYFVEFSDKDVITQS